MNKASKHWGQQMKLQEAAEWGQGGQTAHGKDVFRTGSQGVSSKWLSYCKEERALTQGMMEQIVDLSNLAAALRQVVSKLLPVEF